MFILLIFKSLITSKQWRSKGGGGGQFAPDGTFRGVAN